ncbi:reverse transcriptase [Trichonephila clavipes]|nr:reverse transcriptase [Trichonephila clavipes]
MDKYTAVTQKNPQSLRKSWETLATGGPIPRHLERAEAVARFRLTTGHDFIGRHDTHWLGLAANEACPLCGHARMDGNHLLQCTGLNDYFGRKKKFAYAEYFAFVKLKIKKFSVLFLGIPSAIFSRK